MSGQEREAAWAPWRERLHTIIFEAETPGGRAFDVLLFWAILLSVAAVLLESVPSVDARVGTWLRGAEWFFTLAFTLEYVLRILSVRCVRGYVFSFYGVVDLLAIIPTYLSLVVAGSQSLLVIRALRLLRIFRVLKLRRFMGEAEVLITALRASRAKITVFLGGVLSLVLITGAMMYMIEGQASGFTSIPRAMYWAVVTMTTVGYGDIAPHTVIGQFLASVIMIMGYAIIAVPTGIVSVEMVRSSELKMSTITCPECGREGHGLDALYCRFCGAKL